MRSIAETEECPARPYSSSVVGSWVIYIVLRHRAAAAACDCTPEAAAQIRPADGFLHNQCPNSRVLQEVFFSNMVFYNCGLHRKLFSYHVHYHSFLQCRREQGGICRGGEARELPRHSLNLTFPLTGLCENFPARERMIPRQC